MSLTPPAAGTDWDQTTWDVGYKTIDISFLANMDGDYCWDSYVDAWGMPHFCTRLPGHTGRHLAVNWTFQYPVAVWS